MIELVGGMKTRRVRADKLKEGDRLVIGAKSEGWPGPRVVTIAVI
jgi:hypothetical protein